MSNTIIVVFERVKTNESYDIEIPLDITANELLYGLNEGFRLGLNLEDPAQCYLCVENPIALLKGNVLLSEFKLHDGSRIFFSK